MSWITLWRGLLADASAVDVTALAVIMAAKPATKAAFMATFCTGKMLIIVENNGVTRFESVGDEGKCFGCRYECFNLLCDI